MGRYVRYVVLKGDIEEKDIELYCDKAQSMDNVNHLVDQGDWVLTSHNYQDLICSAIKDKNLDHACGLLMIIQECFWGNFPSDQTLIIYSN